MPSLCAVRSAKVQFCTMLATSIMLTSRADEIFLRVVRVRHARTNQRQWLLWLQLFPTLKHTCRSGTPGNPTVGRTKHRSQSAGDALCVTHAVPMSTLHAHVPVHTGWACGQHNTGQKPWRQAKHTLVCQSALHASLAACMARSCRPLPAAAFTVGLGLCRAQQLNLTMQMLPWADQFILMTRSVLEYVAGGVTQRVTVAVNTITLVKCLRSPVNIGSLTRCTVTTGSPTCAVLSMLPYGRHRRASRSCGARLRPETSHFLPIPATLHTQTSLGAQNHCFTPAAHATRRQTIPHTGAHHAARRHHQLCEAAVGSKHPTPSQAADEAQASNPAPD